MAKVQAPRTISLILINEIKEVLYFPIWWYSKGLAKVLKGAWLFIKDSEQSFGLLIWVKNIFVPMFGQTDIAGRVISFFLRLFQILWKSIALLILIAAALIFIIIWFILPIFIIWQIIRHI